MAKKTVGQVNKKEQAEVEAFADEMKALEAKHGMRIVPMLQYTNQGVFATLGHQRVDKVELKADEKVETKEE